MRGHRPAEIIKEIKYKGTPIYLISVGVGLTERLRIALDYSISKRYDIVLCTCRPTGKVKKYIETLGKEYGYELDIIHTRPVPWKHVAEENKRVVDEVFKKMDEVIK
ncbi:hypothetical protein [Chitinophaga pinensis]|uniref:Uncharacterized protein n=1 Tax=Chitinophaga pinensis (strain ATCC 43595 / DSM 2588 / LMG 13176 / NBRC 15968 / NCIMB 11800 / UQM 2034) TaxID=485918 RepID=A0A979G4P8_CHIPD|nr:hypothetical protein [Chitinophaga pinensis]ACU60656.1 hypothetical protein Cpin_3189 [Chitinophaga pinensis DSM 2588]